MIYHCDLLSLHSNKQEGNRGPALVSCVNKHAVHHTGVPLFRCVMIVTLHAKPGAGHRQWQAMGEREMEAPLVPPEPGRVDSTSVCCSVTRIRRDTA
jgi:hypothetical protein